MITGGCDAASLRRSGQLRSPADAPRPPRRPALRRSFALPILRARHPPVVSGCVEARRDGGLLIPPRAWPKAAISLLREVIRGAKEMSRDSSSRRRNASPLESSMTNTSPARTSLPNTSEVESCRTSPRPPVRAIAAPPDEQRGKLKLR